MLSDETHVLDELKTQHYDYQNYDMSSNILEHFNECRENKLYTDVNIKVEDKIFPCHKILLDAACPFFTSFFSFSDQQQKSCDLISLNEVTAAAFAELLNFIYTSKLTISSETVVDILHGADFLQFPMVVKWCSGYLLQYMNYENCYKIYEIAYRHSLSHLAFEAWNFILENFENLILTDDFCKIPENDLIKILSSDFLRVSNEKVTLQAINKWVNFDVSERKMLVTKLTDYVRLTKEELNNQEIITGLDSDIYRKDFASRLKKILVVISRDTDQFNRDLSPFKIIYYDPENKRWEHLSNFPFNLRQMFGVCVVNNNIYLTGGVGNDLPLSDPYITVYNTCWEYNARMSSWKEKKTMGSPRFNHSSAGLLDCLYVVGGRGEVGRALRSDGASYDLAKDQWTQIAPIRGVEGVSNSALVPLDGRLFLLGGVYSIKTQYNGHQIYNYEEAQYYNPEDMRWHELPALSRQLEQSKSRVSQLDCLSIRGFIILIDDKSGKYIHVYNPLTRVMSKLIQCHGYHRSSGSIVYDNKLILSGGNEARFEPHDMVHSFDMTDSSKGWTMLPPLPVSMSGHICVSIFR